MRTAGHSVSARQALEEIRGRRQAGDQAADDAGLKTYFDTISHEKRLACVRRRIADRSVLGLIRMWLRAVVAEPGENGTGRVESKLEGKFGLEINRHKTRVVEVKPGGASLDFLKCTFRRDRDRKGRPKKRLNVFTSEKSVAREREKLRTMTDARQSNTPIPQLVERLDRHLKRRANYFGCGSPRGAWWEIDWFVRGRLIRHLGRRSQRPPRSPKGFGWYEQIQSFGLIQPNRLPPNRRRAHAGGDIFWRAGCGQFARPVRRGGAPVGPPPALPAQERPASQHISEPRP